MIVMSMEQLIDLGRELFPSRTTQVGGKPKMTTEEFEDLVREFEAFTASDDRNRNTQTSTPHHLAARAVAHRAGVFWA
jgi:hypothetical protein